MAKQIKLGDKTYDLSRLSHDGQRIFEMLQFTSQRLEEAQQKEAALMRAKNEYVAELRAEIVKGMSGIDLNALLGD